MSTIDEQVLRVLERFLDDEGIARDGEVAVAFSGGSDSLALLHALSTLVGGERVHALYVNHHLRSRDELAREIELNQHNCRLLGVSFTLLDLKEGAVARTLKDRGRGIEEAARHLRYDILARTCRERSIPYLLTAHNSDDQLETLLMRVAQASSIASLASIRRRRALEGVTVLRPLLEVSHRELEEYARSQGLAWSQDSTNEEDTYLRNALRREVKKPLLALFPNARNAAVVLARRFEETSRLLDHLVEEALGSVTCERGAASFSVSWYRALSSELRELLLYRMAGLIGSEGRIARTLIVELERGIDELEQAGTGGREIGTLHLEIRGGTITLSPIAVSWSYCLPLNEPMKGQRIALPGDVDLVIREFDGDHRDKDALRLDASALRDPVIRTAHSGDEIALSGGRVRVAKLLSSMGIAVHRREMVPILVDRSGVVAVFAAAFGGRDRIAERFKAPLAHPFTNIYSSSRRDRNSEI